MRCQLQRINNKFGHFPRNNFAIMAEMNIFLLQPQMKCNMIKECETFIRQLDDIQILDKFYKIKLSSPPKMDKIIDLFWQNIHIYLKLILNFQLCKSLYVTNSGKISPLQRPIVVRQLFRV